MHAEVSEAGAVAPATVTKRARKHATEEERQEAIRQSKLEYGRKRRRARGVPVRRKFASDEERKIAERERNRERRTRPEYKAAMAEHQRKYRRGRKSKAGRRKREYGLLPEQYDFLLSNQGGVCATPGCGATEKLVVDHCHVTGHVRGLLCFKCNVALGNVNDNPARLRALADYIERAELERDLYGVPGLHGYATTKE